MIEIPKVVFTKTLNKSEWTNTDIATGDLKDEINKVKESRRWRYHRLWWCLIRFLLD